MFTLNYKLSTTAIAFMLAASMGWAEPEIISRNGADPKDLSTENNQNVAEGPVAPWFKGLFVKCEFFSELYGAYRYGVSGEVMDIVNYKDEPNFLIKEETGGHFACWPIGRCKEWRRTKKGDK